MTPRGSWLQTLGVSMARLIGASAPYCAALRLSSVSVRSDLDVHTIRNARAELASPSLISRVRAVGSGEYCSQCSHVQGSHIRPP